MSMPLASQRRDWKRACSKIFWSISARTRLDAGDGQVDGTELRLEIGDELVLLQAA
jgi:hypothetical protein